MVTAHHRHWSLRYSCSPLSHSTPALDVCIQILALQQNQSRGSFGWRCLPPTRAMLTFERNSEH
ncbi:hypothetical protein EYF80_037415 [Liparis tanakae]|uniref:Uncharacterized protein n=1 Tax=Liparis tanakae TaxID=230148 RepID=A0A4Z2GI77_9TELE|nr:hypothetical protein EYF80_037415 [Liparis tanakae]